ncbi:MAG: HEAT repeat domain-containing protein [Anaerolineae bacterium]|nr:HEAT repeat domain-containing protein [Anaerolineae bacterium]
MTFESLLQRLDHPDAAVRAETLQILAMVEETRALQAVARVFRHDPDPRVRQTAAAAGRLLQAAQQRGHSTEQALAAHFAADLSNEREALFLDGVAREMSAPDTTTGKKKKGSFDPQAEHERLRQERAMLDALYHEQDSASGAASENDLSLSDLASDLLDEE